MRHIPSTRDFAVSTNSSLAFQPVAKARVLASRGRRRTAFEKFGAQESENKKACTELHMYRGKLQPLGRYVSFVSFRLVSRQGAVHALPVLITEKCKLTFKTFAVEGNVGARSVRPTSLYTRFTFTAFSIHTCLLACSRSSDLRTLHVATGCVVPKCGRGARLNLI